MKYVVLALIGLAGGILGGMGLGGGTLLIPLMTLLSDVPQKTAAAINLIGFVPMAAIAVAFHAKNGLIDKKTRFAHRHPRIRRLRGLFRRGLRHGQPSVVEIIRDISDGPRSDHADKRRPFIARGQTARCNACGDKARPSVYRAQRKAKITENISAVFRRHARFHAFYAERI